MISLSTEITQSCNSISLFFYRTADGYSVFCIACLSAYSKVYVYKVCGNFFKKRNGEGKARGGGQPPSPPTPEYRTYTHVKSAHPEYLKAYNTRSYRAILMERKFCY